MGGKERGPTVKQVSHKGEIDASVIHNAKAEMIKMRRLKRISKRECLPLDMRLTG